MSDQKKTKPVSKADKKLDKSMKNLSGKQLQKEAASKKEARKWKLYGITAIVVVVLVAALLFWDSGFIQRRAAAIKIGERSYSAAEVDYYYYSVYDNMYAYASYYGLDTSKSVKDQEIYEGTTWYQYLCDNAKDSLTNVSMLSQEANAAGYTLDEATEQKIKDEIQQTKDSAKENNVSYGFYLKRVFGRLMTPSIYKKVITEYELAYAYEASKTEGFEVSEDDINSYYDENKDSIDTYDYLCYRVSAMPEDPEEEDAKLTAEDYTAADKAAKELADELLEEMKFDASMADSELVSDERVTDLSGIAASSLSNYTFGEWLKDGKRKSGDTTILTDTTKEELGEDEEETEVTSYYYAVLFRDRKLDEYKAASIHTILVTAEASDESIDYGSSLAKAEELRQKFNSGDKTEEAFLALTEDAEDADPDTADSADSSAESEEPVVETAAHSYESVSKGSLTDALEDLLYGGKDHQPGDVEIVQDTQAEGYQLVYFVGYDEVPAWKNAARKSLQSEQYQEWVSSVSDNYEPVETSFFSMVG